MSESFWCPRREENGAMPGPNGEPPRFFPEQDVWREPHEASPNSGSISPYDRRTCSYCGSWHPDDMLEYIENGGQIGPTDKSYKIYLACSPNKFYFQHLDADGKRKFIELLNAQKVVIGHPGHFYVMPFFAAYRDAS